MLKTRLSQGKIDLLCGIRDELISLELTADLLSRKVAQIGVFGSGMSKSGADVKFNVRREGNGNYYIGLDVLA